MCSQSVHGMLDRWVIEELVAQERAVRERGAALDREIDEYSRQIEEAQRAKEQAAASARIAFGTDETARTEYPAASYA